MNRRLIKQLLYGTGYLVFLGLIIFVVYVFWFKPAPTCFDNKQNQGESGVDCGGPCMSCEIKYLKEFQASWIKTNYLSSVKNLVIVAEIKNLNFNYGADYFDYDFNLYDINGKSIQTFSDKSFIYAGEIKNLLKIVTLSPAEFDMLKKIEISFLNISWKLSEEFKKPEIETREIITELTTPVNISGKIINKSPFTISEVNPIGLLFDDFGVLLAASKTTIRNLSAFKEQSFKIVFPKETEFQKINPDSTKIYIEAKK